MGRYAPSSQRPHLAPALAGDNMVALPESAALHKHLARAQARGRSVSETSRAGGYSQLGSVGWAGVGSVGFTPGAGRGSGRPVVRQCAGSVVRQGRAGAGQDKIRRAHTRERRMTRGWLDGQSARVYDLHSAGSVALKSNGQRGAGPSAARVCVWRRICDLNTLQGQGAPPYCCEYVPNPQLRPGSICCAGGASRERGETRGGGWHRAEDPETLAHHRLEDLWRMWRLCCPQAHEIACTAVWGDMGRYGEIWPARPCGG